MGWKCKCDPENHPVAEYQFDVLIGADGKRNTLSGKFCFLFVCFLIMSQCVGFFLLS